MDYSVSRQTFGNIGVRPESLLRGQANYPSYGRIVKEARAFISGSSAEIEMILDVA